MKDDSMVDASKVGFTFTPYNSNFKLVEITPNVLPQSPKQWFWCLYGFDIFWSGVPLFKVWLTIFVIVLVIVWVYLNKV